MGRLHPVHLVTLTLAALAALFAFVAMQVAFGARDAAQTAAHGWNGDNSYEIQELQDALIRAGVIDDPSVFPDDHHELDGPWARCLSAADLADMGLSEDEVELPPPCDSAQVELVVRCDEPASSEFDLDLEVDDVAEACLQWYLIDGRRFEWWEAAYPVEVEAAAEEWYVAEGTDGIDRLTLGQHEEAFMHVVGDGWVRLEQVPSDW